MISDKFTTEQRLGHTEPNALFSNWHVYDVQAKILLQRLFVGSVGYEFELSIVGLYHKTYILSDLGGLRTCLA